MMMNKAILISIRPKWCASMMNGDKKVEVRKGTALYKAIQKLIVENGYADIYVYCTKGKPFLFEENMSDDRFVDKKPYQTSIQPNKYLLEYDEYLNGKVAFKFRCYKVEKIKLPYTKFGCSEWVGCEEERTLQTQTMDEETLLEKSCLEEDEIYGYLNFKKSPNNVGCAIHINDLEIFDKPKELNEFKIKYSPQSWCYCEGE